jgi:hypothetical protein
MDSGRLRLLPDPLVRVAYATAYPNSKECTGRLRRYLAIHNRLRKH